jgi:Sulfotransferase family
MNRPVFVIGSPRSGTSILTWCLGQHSNILAQEESDWLGRFSLDIALAYRSGSRRGERSQFGALGVSQQELFASLGSAVNDLILRHRGELTRIAREQAMAAPNASQILPAFKTERSDSDSKQRWVDGTPEYSFYVCGLRKLFPEAVFVHIVRDVSSVVRSILHFSSNLVQNEQQAYDYWLRTVRAGVRAERAYGSAVVHRLQYSSLVDQPEPTFRSLFNFLREPYEAACLEPLSKRINTSNVPADFRIIGAKTDPRVFDEARQLERKVLVTGQLAPDASAIAELEAEFEQRVHHNENVNSYHRHALTCIAKLEKEIEQLITQRSTGAF